LAEQANHIEMINISKSFGGVHALKNVSLSVKKGEIHALVGENGAGKSTLMKILAGAYHMDEGQILIDGKEVRIDSPRDGLENGISIIYQEFALVTHLTVAENIFIDNLNEGGGLIKWKKLRTDAKKILDDLGFGQIDVKKTVSDLSVAYQQIVEICKALSRNSSILVLDEPTAVLSSNEVEQLFSLLKKLKESGVAIVYISHRMEEIFRICDRITVLKDGENVKTLETKDIDQKSLVNLMIGRDLKTYFPPRASKIGDVVFEAKNICRGDIVKDVSFSVKAGEVLGISGLVGSGRTETMRAIFGEDKRDSGTVVIRGRECRINSPQCAVKSGFALLPEDRKNQGVLLSMPILHNITLSCLKSRFKGFIGVIKSREEREFAGGLVDKLRIKIGSIKDDASSLSGGNQQKVAISKLLATDCGIYIMDEPTRGVDVGAKIEIYKIINTLVEEGNAVVMISSEMPEVIGMCDRVAIMRNGELVGELQKDEINEQNLINYAMGVN
jgi:ribose transport system ATP-binding protein